LHVAVYAGLAINYVIAHLGEFLRSAIIARERKIGLSTVLASVFVERTLDFIALLILLAGAVATSRNIPEYAATAGVISAAVVGIAVGGLFLLLHPFDWMRRFAAVLCRVLPDRIEHWLAEQLHRFREGLVSIKDSRLMVKAILLSVLQWSFVVFLMWGSALAIGQSITLSAATATFVFIVVGLTLPNAPLQIGTNQLAFIIGYGIDGVDATSAVAASFVFTMFALVPTMLIGGVCFARGRLIELLRSK
jgi:uncharacterized protein (TIRG00374 family)